MAKPWTELVRFAWRPTLNFWERRLLVLRQLENQSLLTQFKVEDDEVGARIETGEVTVRSSGMTVSSIVADYDYVVRVIPTVFERIAPDRLTGFFTWHQFIIPANGSYDAVRTTSAARLFRDIASRLGTTDFAVLMDMDEEDSFRQVEFGVLSTDEIPDRLARIVGRTGATLGFSQGRGPAEVVHGRELPAVALFADVHRRLKSLPEGQAWVVTELEKAREGAETFVSLLQEMIVDRDGKLRGVRQDK